MAANYIFGKLWPPNLLWFQGEQKEIGICTWAWIQIGNLCGRPFELSYSHIVYGYGCFQNRGTWKILRVQESSTGIQSFLENPILSYHVRTNKLQILSLISTVQKTVLSIHNFSVLNETAEQRDKSLLTPSQGEKRSEEYDFFLKYFKIYYCSFLTLSLSAWTEKKHD